jgi:phenylacetate-CoA ligase
VQPVFSSRLERTWRYYDAHARRERLSLERNLELQWAGLRRLLIHAVETTPFYRRRFQAAGVDPRRMSSAADLRRIPPLTREDIKTRIEDLCSRHYRRGDLVEAATGGTTDVPVTLYRNREMLLQKTAVQMRFNAWAGWEPGDRVMLFWGAQSDFPATTSLPRRLLERYVRRQAWAPVSLLNEEAFERQRRVLDRFRPRVVVAYPSPLALFCEWLSSRPGGHHRPLSVICTAESTSPEQRATIEDALGCPVFDHYGARDFGMIAAQCERRGALHVNPHAAYLEYEPVAGGEAEGLHEILVTDLLNYGMPLIRYRVNDCSAGAEAGPCPCGRGYPRMREIVGRTTDNFPLANGDVVPGVSLTNRVIKVSPGLRKMQVVQHRRDAFEVRYVPSSNFGPQDLERLRAKMEEFVGPAEIVFVVVDDIARERSGKTRLCISKVSTS